MGGETLSRFLWFVLDRAGAVSGFIYAGRHRTRPALKKFQLGFVKLLGRHAPLPDADMQAFTDFILQVMYPPNPIRRLDNSLTSDQAAGGNAEFGVQLPGLFGTDGRSSRTGGRPQMLKVPHLRNLYQKVGMFGFPDVTNFPGAPPIAGLTGFLGDQVRGFGFLSAGDFDTIMRFHNVFSFDREFPFGPNPGGFAHGEVGNPERRQAEAFLLAFDSNHAPIVGQQVTLRTASGPQTDARIDLMTTRAEAGECDLVAKVGGGATARGYLYLGDGTFMTDRAAVPVIPGFVLRLIARLPGQETTYTCVPAGAGRRIGVDRDMDGIPDRDASE